MAGLNNKQIERLSLYHCLLSHGNCGKEFISSSEIAETFGIDDSLVRKDLSLCQAGGRQKSGYQIATLKSAIENTLGFQDKKKVFIIGAGNLGFALAKYADFKDYGIEIAALFDNSPDKIGLMVNGKKVLSLTELKKTAQKLGVSTAILAVPPEASQQVAEQLVNSGINFIWNFTPQILHLPANIIVHYENFISGFLKMQNL